MIGQALCSLASLQSALIPPSNQQHNRQHRGRTASGPDARALYPIIQRRSFGPALRPRVVSSGVGPSAPPPPPNPDASPGAVAEWARATFLAAIEAPEDQINLAKVGLLISLEEEAAAQAHRATNDPAALLPDLQILRGHLFRGIGTPSTWDLSRFESIADEVLSHLRSLGNGAGGSPSPAPDAAQLSPADAQASSHWSTSGSADGSAEAAAAVPTAQPDGAADRAENVEGETPQQIRGNGSGTAAANLSTEFPFTLVGALNAVLYQRQGYRRMARHGTPQASQLHIVMENGLGSPVVMAMLYMEVARRAGLTLQPLLLDGGRYCLLFPNAGSRPKGLAGSALPLRPQLLIDPYDKGNLLGATEVRELFELGDNSPSAFQPATPRQLVAALLAGLRDAHWAAASGSRPEPALLRPLTPSTALQLGPGRTYNRAKRGADPSPQRRLAPFALSRALAAAERRCAVLPDDWEAQLQLGVLQHLAGNAEDAWLMLGVAAERLPQHLQGSQAESDLAVLLEKARLTVEAAAW